MLQVAEHFSQCEEADQDRHHFKSVKQLCYAEGKALDAECRVKPHRIQHQAKQTGNQCFLPVFTAERCNRCQTHDAQRKVFTGPELQSCSGKRHGEEHQDENTQQAAENRSPERDAHSFSGPPFFQHRIAVKRRNRCGRGARCVDGNSCDGASVICADVNAHQHDQRHGGAHGIGHRQQQCNRHGR